MSLNNNNNDYKEFRRPKRKRRRRRRRKSKKNDYEEEKKNDYEEEKKNKPILEIYEYKLKTFCNSSPQLWFTNISKNKNCGIVKDDFDNIDEELLNYRSCDLMDSKINYQQNTSEKVFNKDKNITNL